MAVSSITHTLQQWAYPEQDNPLQRPGLARMTLRVLLILVHVFFKTNISLRASALTYSIILSLVPMLALSTAILKGLGSDNDLKIAAYQFIEQMEPAGPATPLDSGNNPVQDKDTANTSLTTHLRNAVDVIFDYVDRTNFAALGAFGVVGLIVVVLLMLNNIEITMNVIWHSTRSRPLGRKIMDYLALLILLPVSLNTAFAGVAILQNEKMMQRIVAVLPSEWLVGMLFKGLPFLFIVGSLTFMYQFFPYARVRTYAAFLGALFASICWFLVLQLYITLQIGVSQYNAIYGSFAMVPLFLIWLHLGWIFLLLGAALAYAVQNRDRYNPLTGNTATPLQRVQLAFDILRIVYDNFYHTHPTTLPMLARELTGEPITRLTDIVKILLKGGLLFQVSDQEEITVTPAQPLPRFNAEKVLELILGKPDPAGRDGQLAGQIFQAAKTGIPHPPFTIRDQRNESPDQPNH